MAPSPPSAPPGARPAPPSAPGLAEGRRKRRAALRGQAAAGAIMGSAEEDYNFVFKGEPCDPCEPPRSSKGLEQKGRSCGEGAKGALSPEQGSLQLGWAPGAV